MSTHMNQKLTIRQWKGANEVILKCTMQLIAISQIATSKMCKTFLRTIPAYDFAHMKKAPTCLNIVYLESCRLFSF